MEARKMLKAFTVALLLSAGATAQNQISGNIVNNFEEPIEGVSVVLLKENVRTLTDSLGNYTISDLQGGLYQVRASLFGYETQVIDVDLKSDTQVDFHLLPSFFLQKGVEVRGIRAEEESTPMTFTNLNRETIERQNYGQDIPILIQSTPSVVSNSDAGAGIGYTNFSIRGIDPSRTNITVDGIPMNDAETQLVFWVNMPDISASTESIQIQRGVGTSTNGGGAFGASINIESIRPQRNPYVVLDNTYGSFNTWKNSVSAGTGLIKDKFSLEARLSRISSEGYIDRATSDLKSFHLAGTYLGKKSTLKLKVFSGKERTYQAWYGTPESRFKNDSLGMLDYIGRNGLTEEEAQNLLESGRTYNAYTYDNETDNYQQDHYQVHYGFRFNESWNLKLAGFFVRGRGYFENYFKNQNLTDYDMTPLAVNEDSISQVDLIYQDWLDNYFGGATFNANYKSKRGLSLTLGGGASRYDGNHFAKVPWAEYANQWDFSKKYFKNRSLKYDANTYFKVNYEVKKWNFYADLQYRFIDYLFVGIDKVNDEIKNVAQEVNYHFFNPKAGLIFSPNEHHSLYVSYGIANREPVRDDFRQNTIANRPKHETLYDLEVGYRMKTKNASIATNVYWMDYKNQLILNGEINDVGEYSRVNVDKSFRLGFELEGNYSLGSFFEVSGNLMYSKNKIPKFIEYIDQYDENWNPIEQKEIKYTNTNIAFSPEIIAGIGLHFQPIKGLNLNWMNKYVGKQYLDNTSNDLRSIEGFIFGNAEVSYSFKWGLVREILLGVQINNLYNQNYASSGYSYSYIVGQERIQENFYYPQAGIHYMVRLRLKI